MADGIEFSITGLDPVLAKMRSVGDDMKHKGGRFALRKAAQVIRDAAKRNAEAIDDPQSPTNISLNISERFSTKRFKSTGDLEFRVGVLGGARVYANTKENVRSGKAGQFYSTGGDSNNPGGDTFYWRFLEFGTEKMPATPFMRRSLSDNINAVISAFVTNYDKALDRAIRRAAKVAQQGG